ncbi:hypothetical protein PFICI_08993 [Pestalotiopsis fici W106-1]|uniref:Uncharacterized protein n=1 Tax=Pestalotiopsis fici (strain W106-1 / CGMCC3.15140) TaxID=1229662 RepID=W3WZ58_PESFW|nr:uncharacterized protein PFICI_08993 [Pestalotiopsis fici W106-1]ETS79140.1 hypothetical protein PFICI_08993 [Pestalotiopsis fici W106-1]
MPDESNDYDDTCEMGGQKEEAVATTQDTLRTPRPKEDGALDLAEWLSTSFGHLIGTSSYWMFWKPIAWLDKDMATHCGDRTMRHSAMDFWLSGCPRFFLQVNTLVGFFYTTEGEPEKLNAANAGIRHPWLAFLRPVDVLSHPFQYSAMELLIWDCAAENRWPSHPRRKDLLPMQQRLIDTVGKELPRKFPEEDPFKRKRYYLERVLVGGCRVVTQADPSKPLHTTRKILSDIVNGSQPLPLTDESLIAAGWKNLEEVPVKKNQFPRNPADDSEPERIIFHPPPRGSGSNGPSLCRNDLYDAALEARKRDPQCIEFRYDFRITTRWYDHLKKENRQYNHILVESWNKVFDECGIPHTTDTT